MKKKYCLAASLKGDELTIGTATCDEVRGEHLRAVMAAEQMQGSADRRAFAASVEWERLGDFMTLCGSAAEAAKAYREALLSCLDGDYYDHGRICLPGRFLRIRFVSLIDKVEVFCRGDVRLKEVVLEHPSVREARKPMCGGDF